jgi:hypothetical protein
MIAILYNMKKLKLFISFSLLFFTITLSAQVIKVEDTEQYEGLKFVSIAHQLAVYGYSVQDPLYLITAAQTLVEYPVKGALLPDSIVLNHAENSPSKAGGKEIQLDPYVLLNDAASMATGDTLILAMIDRTREKAKSMEGVPRGRKFSPLIQEYVLDSDGKVKLWTTFMGKEIAEVFVTGNGSTVIDLYLYDQSGHLIASDIKNIENCYISFTPPDTKQYSIEIRNNGKSANRCLLMTN